MTYDLTQFLVLLCLWPWLSYSIGSMLPWAAKHWRWFRWLRPVPPQMLGAAANVLGAGAAGLAVWLA